MKYIILMLISSVVSANEFAPASLKDSVITVTLKNGKKYTMSGNKYEVALRAPKGVEWDKRTTYVFNRYSHKNSVRLLGGVGPSGALSTIVNSNSATVSTEQGFIYGVSYTRQLSKDFSVEAVGLSNATGLLGVGVSF